MQQVPRWLRRSILFAIAVAAMIGGAGVIPAYAPEGWWLLSAFLFLPGLVIAAAVVGDWIRERRPNVD